MQESTLSSSVTELQAGMARNFRELLIELHNVQRKELRGLSIALAQASISRNAGFDDDGASSSSTHTVAYYEAADAGFPRFRLRPMGLLVRMMSAAGLPGVTFADQPGFSKAYFVLATQWLGARAILDRKVRQWLLAHPGMCMEAGGTGVMVYRSGGVLPEGEVDVFAGEAAELLGLIDQARRTAAASTKQPSEIDEARVFAKLLPTSQQRAMEKYFLARRVTPAEMDAFLRQSLPRKIPKNIAYYYDFAFGLVVWGCFYLVGAAVVGYGGATMRQWGAFFMVAICLMVAGVMLYFGVPRLRRERRLLQYGALGVARIRDVEPTGNTENGDDTCKVRAYCEVGGKSTQVQCPAWLKPARRIAAEGKPARILYDPMHPERIMLVDTLVNRFGE